MRRLILVVALLAGCGDNIKPEVPDDAPMSDATDAAIDAPTQSVGPCLDRPTDLERPPSGALPCDLLPPGFTVTP